MSANVIEISQGTADWKQLRSGKVTASRMSDVLAKLKSGGEAAGRRNYRAQLVAEILTGKPCEDGYLSSDMQRGTELEPFARAAYEVKHGVMVETVGFVIHGTIDRFGCSPDGFLGSDCGLEIKVPKIATHLDWLMAGKIPTEHVPQIIGCMSCTGRTRWEFCSYCPDLPERLQLFTASLECEPDVIEGLEREVNKFLGEVDEVLENLGKLVTA